MVTTGSGGALELASLAQLPVFPKNESALGQLLSTLVADRSEVRAIATQGQAIALREFGADRMIDRMEVMLGRVADARPRPNLVGIFGSAPVLEPATSHRDHRAGGAALVALAFHI